MATTSQVQALTATLQARAHALRTSTASTYENARERLRQAFETARTYRNQGQGSVPSSTWTAFEDALRRSLYTFEQEGPTAGRTSEPAEMVFALEETGAGPDMTFTLEETRTPTRTPTRVATAPPTQEPASFFSQIIETVTGPAAPAAPGAPAAPTGKVAQAAEAVTETVGGAWQSVKRAVGLPAGAPAVPADLPREAVEMAERVMAEAEARGVTPQQVARTLGPAAQQAVAAVQRQVTPFYAHPAFIISATLGGAGLVWFIAKALKKRKTAPAAA